MGGRGCWGRLIWWPTRRSIGRPSSFSTLPWWLSSFMATCRRSPSACRKVWTSGYGCGMMNCEHQRFTSQSEDQNHAQQNSIVYLGDWTRLRACLAPAADSSGAQGTRTSCPNLIACFMPEMPRMRFSSSLLSPCPSKLASMPDPTAAHVPSSHIS